MTFDASEFAIHTTKTSYEQFKIKTFYELFMIILKARWRIVTVVTLFQVHLLELIRPALALNS
jgi:hypothetical protein